MRTELTTVLLLFGFSLLTTGKSSKWTTREFAEPIQNGPRSYTANRILVMNDQIVKQAASYFFSCRARLLSNPSEDMWTDIVTRAVYKFADRKPKWAEIGRTNMIRFEDGWMDIGGDFVAPEDVEKMTLLVTVEDEGVSVEIDSDSVLLLRLERYEHWKEEADERIRNIRMGQLRLNIENKSGYEPNEVKLKLRQTGSSFPVGSAVKGHRLASARPDNKKYAQFFYQNFNFGTPEGDVAWRLIEKEEGKPDFENGDKSIPRLIAHGYGSRAGLAWGRSRVIPHWMLNKTSEEIIKAVERRMEYIAERYGDKVTQWDVNNEQLHEAWYAEQTHDPEFLAWMFESFHTLAPSAKLFLNDYMVFSNGKMTMAYKHQADKLLKEGVPVHGMGLQAHFLVEARIEHLMKRLEVLSQLGLPLWLTEFDCASENREENERMFEDTLRLAYSTPLVEGIVFWGFWQSAMWRPLGALAEGPNFKLTPLGEIFKRLFFHEWRTEAEFYVHEQKSLWELEGFYGSYEIIATHKGDKLWSKEIHFTREEHSIINIDI